MRGWIVVFCGTPPGWKIDRQETPFSMTDLHYRIKIIITAKAIESHHTGHYFGFSNFSTTSSKKHVPASSVKLTMVRCFTMCHYVSLCFTMFHYVSLCFTMFHQRIRWRDKAVQQYKCKWQSILIRCSRRSGPDLVNVLRDVTVISVSTKKIVLNV